MEVQQHYQLIHTRLEEGVLNVCIVQVNGLTLMRGESETIAVCFKQTYCLLARQIWPNGEMVHGHSLLSKRHEVICLDDVRVVDPFLVLLLDVSQQGLDLLDCLLHVGDIC